MLIPLKFPGQSKGLLPSTVRAALTRGRHEETWHQVTKHFSVFGPTPEPWQQQERQQGAEQRDSATPPPPPPRSHEGATPPDVVVHNSAPPSPPLGSSDRATLPSRLRAMPRRSRSMHGRAQQEALSREHSGHGAQHNGADADDVHLAGHADSAEEPQAGQAGTETPEAHDSPAAWSAVEAPAGDESAKEQAAVVMGDQQGQVSQASTGAPTAQEQSAVAGAPADEDSFATTGADQSTLHGATASARVRAAGEAAELGTLGPPLWVTGSEADKQLWQEHHHVSLLDTEDGQHDATGGPVRGAGAAGSASGGQEVPSLGQDAEAMREALQAGLQGRSRPAPESRAWHLTAHGAH